MLCFARESVESHVLLDICGEDYLSVRKHGTQSLVSRVECQPLWGAALAGGDEDVLALLAV